MNELREIIQQIAYSKTGKYLNTELEMNAFEKRVDKVLKDIKQWAKGCVPEERTTNDIDPFEREGTSKAIGFNQCRKKILEKIEEE